MSYLLTLVTGSLLIFFDMIWGLHSMAHFFCPLQSVSEPSLKMLMVHHELQVPIHDFAGVSPRIRKEETGIEGPFPFFQLLMLMLHMLRAIVLPGPSPHLLYLYHMYMFSFLTINDWLLGGRLVTYHEHDSRFLIESHLQSSRRC
ncbi:hypothetical protein BC830DRAFT_428519 [Chytriomyces sp. MP71]|nr:hypothetical protein BC830DRAFT_428519 [Chytriomyces sp. MP71]